MATIYVILNRARQSVNFVCDSQATIDACTLSTSSNHICSIGTETDAIAILSKNAEDWLAQEIEIGHLSITKHVTVDNGIQIQPCSLNTEPIGNVDVLYEIFHPLTGEWVHASGFDAANNIYLHIQQQYFESDGLTTFDTWTSWPGQTV
jgi:hypothetical protein